MLRLNLSGENIYGRLTIDGIKSRVTARKLRQTTWANTNLVHKTKNGIYDPVTYYHLLDFLMQIDPGQDFRTNDLMTELRATKPQLVWDATTVGRVLTDLAESLYDTNDRAVIGFVKRWNGMTYDMSGHPENRIILHRLHEDLFLLAKEAIQNEAAGVFEKRINSPLNKCPSMLPETA
jgi:hypothetical protein